MTDPLHREGERLRYLVRIPFGAVERFDPPRLIEVERVVELVRQPREE
jgi:hypothetical protein